jgi:4-aminobutyrate--pyruvate transaminase
LVVARAQAHGLIVRAVQDTIAVCPPLVIGDAEVDELLRRLARALDEAHDTLTRAA